ncbi:hypothetical protein LMRF06_1282 [Listeria monocytogenes]|nr:hypothetical protein LMRF06_1282 [Listeria monocytogenes]
MCNDTFNRGTRNTKNILKTFDINGCFFLLDKMSRMALSDSLKINQNRESSI